MTEVRLGIIPATISPYVLARMGESNARRVFFSGRLFGAGEAVTLNLLARVVPPAELDEALEEEIMSYLKVAPGAVGAAKRLTRRFGATIDKAVIEETVTALADTWESAEAQEGIKAFLEKQKPSWA